MTLARTRCVLLGSAGQLAFDLARTWERSGVLTRLTRADLDICDPSTVRETLTRLRPTLVLNCASYNEVDGAEDDRARAFAVNADAVGRGGSPPIPESTLTKPPSAELRPDQTDQDGLPPYPLLDAILEAHLVEGLDAPALVERGFAAAVVDDVLRRLRTSEYKRRQMPPGLKITGKAFGPGRRYPIARAPG